MRPLFLSTDGMVEETLDESELHRHAAERIGEPADEIDGRGEANVQVNNETDSLSPSSSVGYGIASARASSIPRGDRETVTAGTGWKPE